MKRRILLWSLPVLILSLGAGFIRIKMNVPPDQEVNRARKLITEAELAKSPRYANSSYLEAVAYYDSAMVAWDLENENRLHGVNFLRPEPSYRRFPPCRPD